MVRRGVIGRGSCTSFGDTKPPEFGDESVHSSQVIALELQSAPSGQTDNRCRGRLVDNFQTSLGEPKKVPLGKPAPQPIVGTATR